MGPSDADLAAAADAIERGDLVVYPTETVYGLGALATDAHAVDHVFAAKGRDHSDPISMAVPDVERAVEYTSLSELERAFIAEFLPGPVTVVVERGDAVPDELTAGGDRVGIRIPDHPVARDLLERANPLTATSANISGSPSATSVADLDAIRDRVAVVLDAGVTGGGTGSTVVDVAAWTIHRRGARADTVETWLREHR